MTLAILVALLTLGLVIFPVVALVGTQLGVIFIITQACIGVTASTVGLPFSAVATLSTLLTGNILPFLFP